eukprot:CAMPEP_0119087934 /NCGR_PEP_ID=MMETSP1178-20130426/143674_1 /TAXON_ID=33656 /ORGANISM="unid sp, Strain CCMP2000" /LENGTH=80 /DNA_ID=CAMNT_0007071183 /DNA_START=31 /DNA_END=270 /DNA_ORIENTATION=-
MSQQDVHLGDVTNALIVVRLRLSIDVERVCLVGDPPHQQRRVVRGLPNDLRCPLGEVEEEVGERQDHREPKLGARIEEAE